MQLYVIMHYPTGDVPGSYYGLDEAAITALLAERGIPFEFVTEAQYLAALPQRNYE